MYFCTTIFVLFTLLLLCFLLQVSQLEFLKLDCGERLLVNISKILINLGETFTSFSSTMLNLRGIINHFNLELQEFSNVFFTGKKTFVPEKRVTPQDKVLRLHLPLYHKATADSLLVWPCVYSLKPGEIYPLLCNAQLQHGLEGLGIFNPLKMHFILRRVYAGIEHIFLLLKLCVILGENTKLHLQIVRTA